ncbi:glycosyltransferase family 2 protein [Streptomyces sp. NPDC055056]
MRTAVITLVAGRHRHLRLQQHGLAAGSRHPGHYVVVALDDPSVAGVVREQTLPADVIQMKRVGGRLPLAAARNAGARRALDAGAELLIFLDVDCVPGHRTIERYTEVAEKTVGSQAHALLCGTVSYLPPPPPGGYLLDTLDVLAPPHPGRPVPKEDGIVPDGDHRLFWSLSFAATEATWRRTGGFCERYTGYGGEDTDFALTAASAGVGLWWVGGAPAYHQHHPVSRPPVEHLADILRNGAIFRQRWGRWPMEGWMRDFGRLGLVRHDPATDTWSAIPRHKSS